MVEPLLTIDQQLPGDQRLISFGAEIIVVKQEYILAQYIHIYIRTYTHTFYSLFWVSFNVRCEMNMLTIYLATPADCDLFT